MSNRTIALTAMLLALALALHQVERLLLPLEFYPGVKLGLGNLVTLTSLYLLTPRQALLFVILRALLTAALGGLSILLFSLCGALLAFAAMCILGYRWPSEFSLPGLSVAGAVLHNFGQILVAAALSGSWAIGLYLPVLLVSGIVCGWAIGIVAAMIIRALRQSRWVTLNTRLLPLL